MDQTQQPRGDFVAFMNRDKQPGDKRPAFEGRIAKPGTEEKRELTLWAHEYADPKTGEVKVMFNGTAGAVPTGVDPAAQISALAAVAPGEALPLNNLAIAPRQVVLFPNGFKAEAPEKDRPDYYGAFNPGDGSPLVRVSVWARQDRNGRAYLTGATQYPQPGKTEIEMQDTSVSDRLMGIAGGFEPEPAPKSRRGKGRAD